MKLLQVTFVAAVLLGAAFGLWPACGDADADGSGTSCSGGWLDPVTSLCWQDPAYEEFWRWDDALAYCAALARPGYGLSSWRLPTIDELRSLIRGCPKTETRGACNATGGCADLDYDECWNPSCDGCSHSGGPGVGGAYWPAALEYSGQYDLYYLSSSTVLLGGTPRPWIVHFDLGSVFAELSWGGPRRVRCVRFGP